jgi:hypothetical protein
MMTRRRCLRLLPALALPLAGAGCNRSGLVEVRGRLVYKGRGVPSTLVTFQPDDGSRASKAVTDDDGEFQLRYSRQESGVTRGRHTVYLSYVVSADEELKRTKVPKVPREVQAVIARYRDAATSDLHYEVTESGQFIEIEIK